MGGSRKYCQKRKNHKVRLAEGVDSWEVDEKKEDGSEKEEKLEKEEKEEGKMAIWPPQWEEMGVRDENCGEELWGGIKRRPPHYLY